MTEPPAAGWDCHVHVFDAMRPTHGGHYQPADRPLQQIEAVARENGVGHLVLVQPSVYGTDNALLLQALEHSGGRHRGVIVAPDSIGDVELDAMHGLGVRGVRFNLVSPAGERALPLQRFAALAPRLRARGWHAQWYARTGQLAQIATLHAQSGVTCVLDHLGGLGAGVTADDPTWQAAQTLADQGAWIKLSGWYRLDACAPYAALLPQIGRVVRMFGARTVWGSDWPHTAFAPDAMPGYESTWQPVIGALGLDAAEALRQREPAIYR